VSVALAADASEPAKAVPSARFPALDLARMAAALLVVFFHWCFLFNVADPTVQHKPWLALEPFARYGHLGVQLFFMISGFLIVQSAYSKTTGQFLRARVTRLYPAYLACCTLTYAVLLLNADARLSVADYLYNLTMLNGVIDSFRGVPATYVDGAYWTLAVEWKFYALMTLVIACGQLVRVERLLWLWLLACLAYTVHPVPWLDDYLIASWGAYFIAGAACFLARAAGWNISRAMLCLAAFGLCLAQAVGQAAELTAIHHRTFSASIVAGFLAVFFAFFVALSLNPRHAAQTSRWTMVLGSMSYPIYLLHQQIGAQAIPHFWTPDSSARVLVGGLIALFVLALAVHFGVERTTWTLLRSHSRRRAAVSASG
jgi:peptidoglycan/LPS O-acetylase OafA/YrhL